MTDKELYMITDWEFVRASGRRDPVAVRLINKDNKENKVPKEVCVSKPQGHKPRAS